MSRQLSLSPSCWREAVPACYRAAASLFTARWRFLIALIQKMSNHLDINLCLMSTSSNLNQSRPLRSWVGRLVSFVPKGYWWWPIVILSFCGCMSLEVILSQTLEIKWWATAHQAQYSTNASSRLCKFVRQSCEKMGSGEKKSPDGPCRLATMSPYT